MSAPDGLASTLRTLDRTLGREAHVLAERPDLLWQQLHNRLQCVDPPLGDRLALERERRSRPDAVPWVRRRTPLRESRTLVRSLNGHTHWVRGCAVSSDGTFIASASTDKTVRVWDVASGTELAVLTGHTDTVWGCAVSADGSFIVSASGDRT